MLRYLRFVSGPAVAAGLLIGTFCTTSAHAAVLISNLNGNDSGGTTLVGSLDRSKAVGFTLPGGNGYQFDNAVVRLDIGNVTRTLGAGIYGSTAGTPSGSALTTLTIPAFTATGIQNYTLSPGTPLVLQPLTTYFLVVYGTSPGSSTSYIDWMANSPSAAPTGVATFAGAYGDNSGAVTVPPTTASSTANSFAINATAVPEPGTVSLLLLSVLGAGVMRWRRG